MRFNYVTEEEQLSKEWNEITSVFRRCQAEKNLKAEEEEEQRTYIIHHSNSACWVTPK